VPHSFAFFANGWDSTEVSRTGCSFNPRTALPPNRLCHPERPGPPASRFCWLGWGSEGSASYAANSRSFVRSERQRFCLFPLSAGLRKGGAHAFGSFQVNERNGDVTPTTRESHIFGRMFDRAELLAYIFEKSKSTFGGKEVNVLVMTEECV